MHNFVISECVMVGHVRTHFHHSQLAMWRVVVQSYVFL